MSYCRFSSDDFRSDVYVYEDVYGALTICVAGNRIRGYIPRIAHIPASTYILRETSRWRAFVWELRLWLFMVTTGIQHFYLRHAPRQAIDLPHAGEILRCDSYGEAADTLVMLKKLGYNVPPYAIAQLREDEESARKETA